MRVENWGARCQPRLYERNTRTSLRGRSGRPADGLLIESGSNGPDPIDVYIIGGIKWPLHPGVLRRRRRPEHPYDTRVGRGPDLGTVAGGVGFLLHFFSGGRSSRIGGRRKTFNGLQRFPLSCKAANTSTTTTTPPFYPGN